MIIWSCAARSRGGQHARIGGDAGVDALMRPEAGQVCHWLMCLVLHRIGKRIGKDSVHRWLEVRATLPLVAQ